MSREYQGSYVFTSTIGAGYEGRLTCNLCAHTFPSGQKCKAKVCIGVPYCWQHLRIRHHLRIKPSKFGKGLFAEYPRKSPPPDEICFKKFDIICPYIAEKITEDEFKKRYGDDDETTGPYALTPGEEDGMSAEGYDFLDAALRRGAAALANHDANSNAGFVTRGINDMKKNDWTERQDLGRPLSNYPARRDQFSHRPPPGVYLYATRDIKYGDEIFANYGDEYGFEDGDKHKTRVKQKSAGGRARRRAQKSAPRQSSARQRSARQSSARQNSARRSTRQSSARQSGRGQSAQNSANSVLSCLRSSSKGSSKRCSKAASAAARSSRQSAQKSAQKSAPAMVSKSASSSLFASNDPARSALQEMMAKGLKTPAPAPIARKSVPMLDICRLIDFDRQREIDEQGGHETWQGIDDIIVNVFDEKIRAEDAVVRRLQRKKAPYEFFDVGFSSNQEIDEDDYISRGSYNVVYKGMLWTFEDHRPTKSKDIVVRISDAQVSPEEIKTDLYVHAYLFCHLRSKPPSLQAVGGRTTGLWRFKMAKIPKIFFVGIDEKENEYYTGMQKLDRTVYEFLLEVRSTMRTCKISEDQIANPDVVTKSIKSQYKLFLKILLQICNLLIVLKEDYGFCHNDMHESNVMMSGEQAYIIDFGRAHITRNGRQLIAEKRFGKYLTHDFWNFLLHMCYDFNSFLFGREITVSFGPLALPDKFRQNYSVVNDFYRTMVELLAATKMKKFDDQNSHVHLTNIAHPAFSHRFRTDSPDAPMFRREEIASTKRARDVLASRLGAIL